MKRKEIKMVGCIIGFVVGTTMLFTPLFILGFISLILTGILSFIKVEEESIK